MIIDRLYDDVKKKGPVCVGLDTRFSFLPECIAEGKGSAGEKIFEFNRRVVDATIDSAGCYKIQIACYEALGLEGLKCYAQTLSYIREKGCVVIADVKRGDISSTASMYAKAHFSGDFEADIITVNAYMGEDAISPYYDYISGSEKGLFILVKTSNPSGVDLQDLKTENGEPVYLRMAKKVSEWGEAFMGGSGFSSIGAVAGCTYPAEFAAIHAAMPKCFFLIPGYGAQGGTGKDIAEFFKNGVCGVVNSSRAILTAHKDKTEDEDFADYVRAAAAGMKEDILGWL